MARRHYDHLWALVHAERATLAKDLLTRDQPASSAITQDLLGWKPTHPGPIEDIEQGHYFT